MKKTRPLSLARGLTAGLLLASVTAGSNALAAAAPMVASPEASPRLAAVTQETPMVKEPKAISLPPRATRERYTAKLPALASLTGEEIDTLLLERRASIVKWQENYEAALVLRTEAEASFKEFVKQEHLKQESIDLRRFTLEETRGAPGKFQNALNEAIQDVRFIEAYKATPAYKAKDLDAGGVKVVIASGELVRAGDEEREAQAMVTFKGEPLGNAPVTVYQKPSGTSQKQDHGETDALGRVAFSVATDKKGVNAVQVRVENEEQTGLIGAAATKVQVSE